MKQVNWIIFYGDKTTFSNLDGSPVDAPGTNVQVIVQRSKDPRERNAYVWETDHYWWDEEGQEWFGVSEFGLWDRLFNTPGKKIVKSGRTINSDTYREITILARDNKLIPMRK